jgi:hypothetical protein
MSTRANVLIKYKDRKTSADSEQWLYRHYDGNVRGVGQAVVRAVCDHGWNVNSEPELTLLLREFPSPFEDTIGTHDEIDFLYRVTYADDRVTVVAWHGGYAGEDAERHYHRANDTPDNSVELCNMVFKDGRAASFQCDIREPESYIRTLVEATQPAVRAWRTAAMITRSAAIQGHAQLRGAAV